MAAAYSARGISPTHSLFQAAHVPTWARSSQYALGARRSIRRGYARAVRTCVRALRTRANVRGVRPNAHDGCSAAGMDSAARAPGMGLPGVLARSRHEALKPRECGPMMTW